MIAGVFDDIYRRNTWGSRESVSGPGSEIASTREIAVAIPKIIADYGIGSMLDIPCGDFNWMATVDLTGVFYIGADIVTELVMKNCEKHVPNGGFLVLDVVSDPIPAVDMILCRDCLVHFSLETAVAAIHNIAASNSRWLLITTFPSVKMNRQIKIGGWRPLNLELPPFSLPPPERIINERHCGGSGPYADKSLGLWSIDKLRTKLGVG